MENGFGCYRGSPEGIADTVEEWFASTRAEGSMLERMRDSALVAARPDATLDIAKDLADMLYARREVRKGGGGGGVGGGEGAPQKSVRYGQGPLELQRN